MAKRELVVRIALESEDGRLGRSLRPRHLDRNASVGDDVRHDLRYGACLHHAAASARTGPFALLGLGGRLGYGPVSPLVAQRVGLHGLRLRQERGVAEPCRIDSPPSIHAGGEALHHGDGLGVLGLHVAGVELAYAFGGAGAEVSRPGIGGLPPVVVELGNAEDLAVGAIPRADAFHQAFPRFGGLGRDGPRSPVVAERIGPHQHARHLRPTLVAAHDPPRIARRHAARLQEGRFGRDGEIVPHGVDGLGLGLRATRTGIGAHAFQDAGGRRGLGTFVPVVTERGDNDFLEVLLLEMDRLAVDLHGRPCGLVLGAHEVPFARLVAPRAPPVLLVAILGARGVLCRNMARRIKAVLVARLGNDPGFGCVARPAFPLLHALLCLGGLLRHSPLVPFMSEGGNLLRLGYRAAIAHAGAALFARPRAGGLTRDVPLVPVVTEGRHIDMHRSKRFFAGQAVRRGVVGTARSARRSRHVLAPRVGRRRMSVRSRVRRLRLGSERLVLEARLVAHLPALGAGSRLLDRRRRARHLGLHMAGVVCADADGGTGSVVVAPLVGGLAPVVTERRHDHVLLGESLLTERIGEEMPAGGVALVADPIRYVARRVAGRSLSIDHGHAMCVGHLRYGSRLGCVAPRAGVGLDAVLCGGGRLGYGPRSPAVPERGHLACAFLTAARARARLGPGLRARGGLGLRPRSPVVAEGVGRHGLGLLVKPLFREDRRISRLTGFGASGLRDDP